MLGSFLCFNYNPPDRKPAEKYPIKTSAIAQNVINIDFIITLKELLRIFTHPLTNIMVQYAHNIPIKATLFLLP